MQAQLIELDCRGQKCPAPILNIAKTAKQLKGQPAVLQIMADDEAFPLDLKSWCRTTKASLLALDELQGGGFKASVEINPSVGQAPAPSQTPPPSSPQSSAVKRPKLLNYRGLSCPKPILNLAQEFRLLNLGETLEVHADDPAFSLDIRSWGRSTGAAIQELPPEGSTLRVLVSKTNNSASVKAISAPQSQPQAPAVVAPQVPADDSDIRLRLDGLSAAQREQKLKALAVLGSEKTVATLTCNDPSFSAQLVSWCSSQGHTLTSLQTNNSGLVAKVTLNASPAAQESNLPVLAKEAPTTSNECTLLVLHNDFEALMASLMTANAAAAAGMKTSVFFSFWGINLLRAEKPQDIPARSKPNIFQRIFRWLMPKGPKRQQLGKLNFGGMGTGILKGIMDKHSIMGLDGLMQSAAAQGVKFIVCTTSMTIMGLDQRDIVPLPNIEYGGVASFVDYARASGVSLVF